MQYEPQCFEIESVNRERPSVKYLPDFLITNDTKQFYIEIKPDPIQGEESWRSVALACCLGYQSPTIIVAGWPIEYSAFMVNDRDKGNPAGRLVRFDRAKVFENRWDKLCSSSPDELDWEIYEGDRHLFSETRKIESHLHRIASSAWNETKFKWILKNSRAQNK